MSGSVSQFSYKMINISDLRWERDGLQAVKGLGGLDEGPWSVLDTQRIQLRAHFLLRLIIDPFRPLVHFLAFLLAPYQSNLTFILCLIISSSVINFLKNPHWDDNIELPPLAENNGHSADIELVSSVPQSSHLQNWTNIPKAKTDLGQGLLLWISSFIKFPAWVLFSLIVKTF